MYRNDEVVSFDSEPLILVNDEDVETGYKSKAECHDGDGILHRAFSIFIFNRDRELLVQKRAGDKRLWPLYWSNSCCSHPRKGERIEQAALRRMQQELGIRTDLKFLYKFKYHARFEDAGSENELCSVFIGVSTDEPLINPFEISEYKYIPLGEVSAELSSHPENYSPWFKMEWERISTEFMVEVDKLF